MAREGWAELPKAIEAAADWLRSAEEPGDAVIDHFGFSTHLGGGVTIESAVHGWNGGPGGERGEAESAFLRVEVHPIHDDAEAPEPLTEEEVEQVLGWVADAGIEVDHPWHGAGMTGLSVGLRVPGGVSPSLRAASAAYHGGCPKHGSVFCGSRRTWTFRDGYEPTEKELDEAACTWLSHGWEVAVPPGWISVGWAEPEPGTVEKPDDDRSLEAVRAALEKLGPVVGELGIHAATMTAGRKGRIEGEPGDLRFEEEHGHGVQFPAEAAVELVRLALIGAQFEGET